MRRSLQQEFTLDIAVGKEQDCTVVRRDSVPARSVGLRALLVDANVKWRLWCSSPWRFRGSSRCECSSARRTSRITSGFFNRN
ncbi:hypothetical protein CHELA17_63790 [Chelatococcus asaccharovorans]|nr:hypothetical protein CHELA17_63790 [Chelatococcus asaccharovorans]